MLREEKEVKFCFWLDKDLRIEEEKAREISNYRLDVTTLVPDPNVAMICIDSFCDYSCLECGI